VRRGRLERFERFEPFELCFRSVLEAIHEDRRTMTIKMFRTRVLPKGHEVLVYNDTEKDPIVWPSA
jgi:hypothetical protein